MIDKLSNQLSKVLHFLSKGLSEILHFLFEELRKTLKEKIRLTLRFPFVEIEFRNDAPEK